MLDLRFGLCDVDFVNTHFFYRCGLFCQGLLRLLVALDYIYWLQERRSQFCYWGITLQGRVLLSTGEVIFCHRYNACISR